MRAARFSVDAVVAHVPLTDIDGDTRALLDGCIDAQRAASARAHARGQVTFTPHPDPQSKASDADLAAVLRTGVDVSDVRTDDDLGNALVFHTGGLATSIVDPDVVARREQIDARMPALVQHALAAAEAPVVIASGHFWYPPGGYLGWHTNSRVPGWRVYLTYASEPGRSGFRHLDPETGEIHTTLDGAWDLRAFRVGPAEPLWHAVWAECDRFSFGYRIPEPDPT